MTTTYTLDDLQRRFFESSSIPEETLKVQYTAPEKTTGRGFVIGDISKAIGTEIYLHTVMRPYILAAKIDISTGEVHLLYRGEREVRTYEIQSVMDAAPVSR